MLRLVKQQAGSDSADLISVRQAEIAQKLIEGYNQGGMDEAKWLELRYICLRSATRGHLDQNTVRVLRMFTVFKAYRCAYKLLQLLELLEPNFDSIIRIYTNKGLLTLSSQGVRARSSIGDPQDLGTVLEDLLAKKEAERK
jgi:hypothetical protein